MNEKITAAVAAFWSAFADAFPEVTTGDSQLSGEDYAALSLWVSGTAGDNPTTVFDLPVTWVTSERLDDALDNCKKAAAAVLFIGPAPSAPELTTDLLRDCIKHVLHFNPPPGASVPTNCPYCGCLEVEAIPDSNGLSVEARAEIRHLTEYQCQSDNECRSFWC